MNLRSEKGIILALDVSLAEAKRIILRQRKRYFK